MLCYTIIMKNLLVTIIFLFFLAPWKPCLADGVALESLYGQDLLTAPASARLKFQNETGFILQFSSIINFSALRLITDPFTLLRASVYRYEFSFRAWS